MSIRAMTLAGLLGMPLVAGTALAAETGKLLLADAAKQGEPRNRAVSVEQRREGGCRRRRGHGRADLGGRPPMTCR